MQGTVKPFAAMGIDTSNYTTSTALCTEEKMLQNKRLLPVATGQLGLRQSDAVFLHVKALGELAEGLLAQFDGTLSALGVSVSPRDCEGSYMPCFLAGAMAARVTAAALRLPLFTFSHQAGHIAAALYGAGRLDLMHRRFVAFHLSGGTTECVLVENLLTGKFDPISRTKDLNAGQVVDRVGKMLGLPFPAGPALDALACRASAGAKIVPTLRDQNPCLSGIENQCRAMIGHRSPEEIARFCVESILAAVAAMATYARQKTGCDDLLFAGGVMSNSIIRPAMERQFHGIFSPAAFSCDNAAGIALLAACAAGENVSAWRGEELPCP